MRGSFVVRQGKAVDVATEGPNEETGGWHFALAVLLQL